MNRACFLLASSVVGGGLFVFAVIMSTTVTVTAQQTALSPPSSSTVHPEMPDGPGKALVLRACTKCHVITQTTNQHKDNDEWTATITKMIGYGAVGTDDEFETILTYLTENYGPDTPVLPHITTEVNKETAAQLARHLGISDRDAKAIVNFREENGNFKSIDDLKKVPGIDKKKIDDKKDDLRFS